MLTDLKRRCKQAKPQRLHRSDIALGVTVRAAKTSCSIRARSLNTAAFMGSNCFGVFRHDKANGHINGLTWNLSGLCNLPAAAARFGALNSGSRKARQRFQIKSQKQRISWR